MKKLFLWFIPALLVWIGVWYIFLSIVGESIFGGMSLAQVYQQFQIQQLARTPQEATGVIIAWVVRLIRYFVFFYSLCVLNVYIAKALKKNIHLWYRPIVTVALIYNIALLEKGNMIDLSNQSTFLTSIACILISLFLYIRYKKRIYSFSTVIVQPLFLKRLLLWFAAGILIYLPQLYIRKHSYIEDITLLGPFIVIILLSALDDVQISSKIENGIVKIMIFPFIVLSPLAIVALVEAVFRIGLGITSPYSL